MKNSMTPLCVDLDGTLVKSDTLYESFFAFLKKDPLNIFRAIKWLSKGKLYFKNKIFSRTSANIEDYPQNTRFSNFLKAEKQKGRKLYLVTATPKTFAQNLVAPLGLFEDVFGSDEDINLKEKAKADFLVQKFGEKKFCYAGNDQADMKVWEQADEAIVVNADEKLMHQAKLVSNVTKVFSVKKENKSLYLKVLRVHQWIKNILVFVPLIMAHKWVQPIPLMQTIMAFLAFSFCASSVYILNDLFDMPVDRKHPKKKYRPLTSGVFPITKAIVMIAGLLGVSIFLSLLLSLEFLLLLSFYFIWTFSYSVYLKRIIMVDVFCLASFYSLRIFGGGLSTETPISAWLIAFAVFFFLSLAFMKRYAELKLMMKLKKTQAEGRGYDQEDLPLLLQMGLSAGFLSPLVMALYISSPEVMALYSHPFFLWWVCPLLLLWVSMMWYLASRGAIRDEDPIVFTMKQPASYLIGAAIFISMLFAI